MDWTLPLLSLLSIGGGIAALWLTWTIFGSGFEWDDFDDRDLD